jgi:protein-L-isoaspartate(D-aspartate) O-methyltransferase
VDIATARKAFAEELRYVAHVRSDRVIAAFATVPRERFLGAPPWQVYDFADGYWDVPGDDPMAAYHNVLFAIDAARELNNGHPEFWARLLDKLDVRAGDRVFHVGAGLGYYTAIMAELVGADGAVVAVEVDEALATRARNNLASCPNVQVIAADGAVRSGAGRCDRDQRRSDPSCAGLARCVDAGRSDAIAAHRRGRTRHGVPDRASG